MAAAFADLGRPADWWEVILESLGPLLTLSDDGYRVPHNDLRVFLAGRYGTPSASRKRAVTSRLADYFQRPDSDRAAAHVQLFDLLKLTDRQDAAARVFNVDWVLEGGVLGIDEKQLVGECEAAIRVLPVAPEWPLVISVACGRSDPGTLDGGKGSGFHRAGGCHQAAAILAVRGGGQATISVGLVRPKCPRPSTREDSTGRRGKGQPH